MPRSPLSRLSRFVADPPAGRLLRALCLLAPAALFAPGWALAVLFAPGLATAQALSGPARITEEIRTLETYPFSEPNPVPILVRDARLYPYHTFEGYSVRSRPQEWKVVKLENDYIEVFVLPEVGGKVWGAVVKETGHEFIYRNEVMKFRNIALRGPWTSGGIEFNFGVIGHTPATATPVDYTLIENDDGSVSCWVGSMDLPSRTHWRVEIRLPADRAYFETNVLWYNPTPLEQPYYNWMTAAAFARDDLEMSMPGNAYLQHSGQVQTWPNDEEGRYLPLYANNTFESHKSYHVVGELNDFFGGYYHDDDYGFGHWARHEDMPGQKLWLWSLARDGGVWEDLLTDTDGQYVEFQAGRLYVQYSPGTHLNPITQAGFDPMSASRWTETWFPVEGIGGLTDASKEGAMFVEREGQNLSIGVNAFRDIQDTLKVWVNDELVRATPVRLGVLEPFKTSVDLGGPASYEVQLPGLDLKFESYTEEKTLEFRRFARDLESVPALPETNQMIFEARELLKARQYGEAGDLFREVWDREHWNREAMLGLSELSLRQGDPALAAVWAGFALQLDAYDAKANFLAGTAYRGMGMEADAVDALGWAARSVAYRSAAYVQLAELMVGKRNYGEAQRYARLAIDFDRYSVPGWQALAVIGRRSENRELAEQALNELLALDPLHHFVAGERMLKTGGPLEAGPPAGGGSVPPSLPSLPDAESMAEAFGGEYPDQSLLELAIYYHRLGLDADALRLLRSFPRDGPEPLVHRAWIARLSDDPSLLANPEAPLFEFPYRGESYHALSWAERRSEHWVWKYLLVLLHQATNKERQAIMLFDEMGDSPDFAPYYVDRALYLNSARGDDPEPDLRRAVDLEPRNRIFHIHLIQHLQASGDWAASLTAVNEAQAQTENDFNLDLLQAKALANLGRGSEAAEILAATHVLPSENARESHGLWVQAHTVAALNAYDAEDFREAKEHLLQALEWPESLGQGKPYEPEERLVRFIMGRVEEALGNDVGAREEYQAYMAATGEVDPPLHRLDILAPSALRALGREAEAESIASDLNSEFQDLGENLPAGLEGDLIRRALGLGGEDE